MQNNLMDFVTNVLANNPNIANNPNAQQMVQVIQSGDRVRGEEIARNLCNSYGVTPEQAIQQARGFFNI